MAKYDSKPTEAQAHFLKSRGKNPNNYTRYTAWLEIGKLKALEKHFRKDPTEKYLSKLN